MSARVERYGSTILVTLPNGALVMLARPLALAVAHAVLSICADDALDLLDQLSPELFADNEDDAA